MDIKVKYSIEELTALSLEEIEALQTELNAIKDQFLEETDLMEITRVYQDIDFLLEEGEVFVAGKSARTDLEVPLTITRDELKVAYASEELTEIQKDLAEQLGTLVISHSMMALQQTLDMIDEILNPTIIEEAT